ncbi:MAG: CapA family protein, partial [Bacteroidales bacterium]|uniref:CapA family protein n=1 Tax=Porphyromonas sp. TaxID=1924944 RepID=UPI002979FD3D
MNIIVTGDLYLTESNIKSININGVHRSFSGELCMVIQKADFSITNYESAVHISEKLKGISKTGPVLSTSPDAMKIVREMGFDCVTLANNHIRDLGGQGIKNALEVAQQNGIETVGAARTKEAAQRPLYIEIDGVKLAIINFCEN